MRLSRVLAFALGASAVLAAPLPDFYKSVDRVTFVVKDAAAVSAAWEKLGGRIIEGPVDVDLPGGSVAVTTMALDNVLVHWVQPAGGQTIFAAYHRQHGDGLFGLTHRVPGMAALDAEVARLKSLGVAVLLDKTVDTGDGTLRAVYFDTLAEGKYSLGLICRPDMPEAEPAGHRLAISQFAFVARSLDPVSRYWTRLGLPELAFTSGKLSDLVYHGEPGKFTSRLGWQRHGKVVYEWIEPHDGPSTYLDHLARSGEGFHHFGVNVADMDKAIAEFQAKGLKPVMSGGWGEKGKPGSGRFQYLEAPGGVEIELLWSYRAD